MVTKLLLETVVPTWSTWYEQHDMTPHAELGLNRCTGLLWCMLSEHAPGASLCLRLIPAIYSIAGFGLRLMRTSSSGIMYSPLQSTKDTLWFERAQTQSISLALMMDAALEYPRHDTANCSTYSRSMLSNYHFDIHACEFLHHWYSGPQAVISSFLVPYTHLSQFDSVIPVISLLAYQPLQA